MGYIETIKVHQELVKFCEDNKLYNEPLAVTFNMIYALREKDLGFVKGTAKFTKIMDYNHYLEAKYYINESTDDNSPTLDFAKKNFKLIKSITLKHASGSIYENIQYKNLPIPVIQ